MVLIAYSINSGREIILKIMHMYTCEYIIHINMYMQELDIRTQEFDISSHAKLFLGKPGQFTCPKDKNKPSSQKNSSHLGE